MYRPIVLAAALTLLLAPLAATSATPDDSKVKVELYYESQCPGCRETITASFKEAYAAAGFLKMADVTLVPYGNARESADGPPYIFKCQHGPSECQYNLIETCALAKIGCPYKQFQFIDCIENYDENREAEQDYDSVLNACATLTDNSDAAGDIETCYKGDEGNELEHEMATKTGDLSPPHKYVPYVVANGVHSDEVQNKVTDNLLAYVCDTYEGPDRSPQCPKSNIRVGAKSEEATTGVCHRDSAVPDIE